MINAREASARHSLVGSRIGKFDVISEIGTGGMAAVYLASESMPSGPSRLVAIKVMHPHLSQEDSFVEMFLDEARVAATIQHPNVAAILEVGIEDGLIFLVMEYVEGDSFSNVEKMAVNLRRRIPLGITLRVVHDALSGLHSAHELTDHVGQPLRVIHRDVSPQNIMVGVDGVARIVDFGIAKAESRITNTQVGLIKGKLNFMAPEQIRGATLDRRVDVFGMGVTLWEAVTLRRLYAGETEFETARKILSGEYPSLLEYDPKLPPVLDAICHKALQPNPDQRFLTAAEFAQCIEHELGPQLAGRREVAAFIGGVAAQKLERERRAVREALQSVDDLVEDDDEPSLVSRTLVDAPMRPAPEVGAISAVLPSSAAPRSRVAEDGATVKRPPLRSPTMSMPSHRGPARAGDVGGQTRAMRTTPTPSLAGHDPEPYDDDGATAPFQVMALREQVRALRPQPVSAAPQADDDDADDLAEGRTMFQPMQPRPVTPTANAPVAAPLVPRPMTLAPTGLPPRSGWPGAPPGPPSVPVAPPLSEPSAAIDLVQRRGPLGDASTAPAGGDLFAEAPMPTLTGTLPAQPPAGAYGVIEPWQVLPPPTPTTTAPLQPPPSGVPAYVYVLASLLLLAVALGVLLYVLRMRS